MYTQCPWCNTAFRVTAPVLQQADGRVRCDSCGESFNAIERLSEDPPEDRHGKQDVLDSLNELTGPHEIRIEDTGVEWRVIDEETIGDHAIIDADTEGSDDNTASLRWLIEDATGDEPGEEGADGDGYPASPAAVPASHPQGALALSADADQQRYDDDTLLPESFAAGNEPMPRHRVEDPGEPQSTEAEELQVDLALGEPEEWMQLLQDEDAPTPERPESADDDAAPALQEAVDVTDAGEAGPDDEPLADIDTQFGLQALALGIGSSVCPPEDAERHEADDDTLEQELATDGLPGEADAADEQEQATDGAPTDDTERDCADDDHRLPPQTEEEISLNRLIDQDLIRLSREQDVFTATSGTRQSLRPEQLVETIIMEGDTVRNAAEAQAATASLPLSETPGIGSVETGPALAGHLDEPGHKDIARAGARWAAAGVAVLGLLLAAQVVHAWRNSLATYELFERTAGPVYRSLGEPLIPAWNVKGWQFESTSGSTAAGGSILTIASRIANVTGSPLPYPLIHLSLTDRWEETIGSRVLHPEDYLGAAADPERPVAAGSAFTALVRVNRLPAEATGYKLNVCYPESGSRIRCATEAFRD